MGIGRIGFAVALVLAGAIAVFGLRKGVETDLFSLIGDKGPGDSVVRRLNEVSADSVRVLCADEARAKDLRARYPFDPPMDPETFLSIVRTHGKGLLAPQAREQLEKGELEVLRKLQDWDFHVEQRMMLDVSVIREGKQIYTNLGLNDAVIREGPISHVIHLKISSDGRHLADIAGDGVIVSTPTGSTAYSLSAGGPVVEPVAQTMVVCPICTHNMRFSSYVLSPEHVLTVELERNGRKPVYLFVDESRAFALRSDDKVLVRRSKYTTKLVRLTEKSFCEIFAQKMLPGGLNDEK